MRNVFDQYDQAENRLTHAFASALHHDAILRQDFLTRHLQLNKSRAKNIRLSVQSYPDAPALNESEESERGIPDIWFYDDDGWCAVVECKISATLTSSQIKRHIAVAQRRFDNVLPVVIVAKSQSTKVPDGIIKLEWPNLYRWLKSHEQHHSWAQITAQYFEILEQQMVSSGKFVEGSLTTFSGFLQSLGELYSYVEAKRLLALTMEKLRHNKKLIDTLAIDPKLSGRGSITGNKDIFVWDYLQPRQAADAINHTEHIHFTMAIRSEYIEARLTLPNGLSRQIRKRFVDLGTQGFTKLAQDVVRGGSALLAQHPAVMPVCGVLQRRYPSQRAKPFRDANILFDLRTALEGQQPIKFQPQWLAAAYEAFADKESNLQLQFGFDFPILGCPAMQSETAIDLLVDGLCACQPVVAVAYG
jgi:hypothetical protein